MKDLLSASLMASLTALQPNALTVSGPNAGPVLMAVACHFATCINKCKGSCLGTCTRSCKHSTR
jgi:modification target Cys-rich repeat protein